MKNKLKNWLLPIFLLALMPSQVMAQSASLSIEDLAIKAGEEKKLVIDLTNPSDEVTLVQFDLRLPAGLSLKVVDGDYDIDIPGRTTLKKHSLSANAQTDGSIRFLLASSSNAALTGNSGAIITMTVVAGSNFDGGNVTLENILMVTPAEKEIKQSTYTYTISGATPPVPSTGEASLSIESFTISAGEEKQLVIDLTNPSDEVTLVQFDLRLPAGLSLKVVDGDYDIDIAGRTTWKKHSLNANAQADGSIRFLLASSSNTSLSGSSGAIITMTVVAGSNFAGGNIMLENILMVTPTEKEIMQSTYTYGPTLKVTSLYIDSFSFYGTNEAKMVVGLSNPDDEITLVQFDLRLPAGLSLKQDGDDYVYDISNDRTTSRKHSIDANRIGDVVRFLLSSSSSSTFKGTEGAIIEMTLIKDAAFREGAVVNLENIILVTPDEKELRPSNVQYAVTRNKGDVNFDNVVDVADIATIISVMAGEHVTTLANGDVNGDRTVDVADIASVISIMAGK